MAKQLPKTNLALFANIAARYCHRPIYGSFGYFSDMAICKTSSCTDSVGCVLVTLQYCSRRSRVGALKASVCIITLYLGMACVPRGRFGLG